jgi:16S rRNA (cytosine1402-N4)-methyltransferase
MRMNLNATETAKSLVNSYDDERLTKAFKFYGEISYPKRLAYEISSISAAHNILTTTELKDIVLKFAPKNDKNRFLSQVFQALRIEVNGEMDALKEMLTASLKVLKKDGRIVIISYHSLEDRLVKNFFRSGDIDKAVPNADIYGNVYRPFRIITRKVIVPDENEIKINPRIRSAKLRVAEKI